MALPAEGPHIERMGRRRPRWATCRRSPTGRDQFKQARGGAPRIGSTKLVPPNAGGCTDSPSGLSIIQIIGRGAPADPWPWSQPSKPAPAECSVQHPCQPNFRIRGQTDGGQQRAVQAVRDITIGQPTPTLEENQMYDWDGQFNETLGLPIQLRNRVSDPGTPPVRASRRVPVSGGGVIGATADIGSGPRLNTVTEDEKGNGTGEADELPPWQGESRIVPPTPEPRARETQTAESTVGRTSPQEVRRQVDFATSEEGPGRETFAGPGDVGAQRKSLEPTPYGPPEQRMCNPIS